MSYITKDRCDTCRGNIECSTFHVPGTYGTIKEWTCLMCGRDKRPSKFYRRGKVIATSVSIDNPTKKDYAWNKDIFGVY